MQLFVVLAVCAVGAFAAPNYGSYEAPAIRVASYETPVVKVAPAYSSYAAPAYAEVKSYAPAVEIRKPIIPITRFELNDDNYGTFNVEHVSGDGSSVVHNGLLKNLGDPEGPVSVMKGSYSFVGDDSKTYTVTWVADENGFRASGDHLPTPPPMPEEIAKSLAMPSTYSTYEAPVLKVASSYAAPAIRTQTYEAPAIRVVASGY